MKHAGGEQSGRARLGAFDEMPQRADAARGDDRHANRAANRAQQIEIETFAGAVAIHAGQQDFSRAERNDLPAPVDRIDPGRAAAAMGEHLPLPGADCFASTATTTHWLPNFVAASRTNSGRATAAELMLHLSVPASSSRRMSSVERMPPPTVSGRNTRAAVREPRRGWCRDFHGWR